MAAHDGNLGKCRRLLTEGVPADCVDGPFEETALEVAACKGHLNVVAMLLSEGATVDKADKNGFTPLMVAAAYNALTSAVVATLLDHNASVELENVRGWTPLKCAAHSGPSRTDVVALLASHCCSAATNRVDV